MSYDNTNHGSIWPNKRKEKDTQPDFTGSANVDGVDYFVDAWKRKPDAKEGAPSLSFKFKRKDKQEAKPAARQDAEFDDDSGIPF
jgi:hypothetical protein